MDYRWNQIMTHYDNHYLYVRAYDDIVTEFGIFFASSPSEEMCLAMTNWEDFQRCRYAICCHDSRLNSLINL